MPRVLILSATTGYQLRSFGEAAEELGVELVFATDRCHSLDDPWRDSAVAVRFHEEDRSVEAVAAAARLRPVDGVLAVGDRPVVLASRIAAALGLPGNPPDAAQASAHKRLAREQFARAGLPVPWFLPASVNEPVAPLFDEVRFPAVVKPVALSGSRGVIRVDTRDELEAAFRRIGRLLSRPDVRALRTGAEADVVVEGFIPGREYAVEALLTEGRFRPLAIFDKPDPLDGPFFEETIYVTRDVAPKAEATPSHATAPSGEAMAADREAAAILAAVERAARALGLWHGPLHAECRVNRDGVFVLEVAARPIGGLCSRVLRFAAPASSSRNAGDSARPDVPPVSLEHVLLRHALNEDISTVQRENLAAAVMMIPIPRRGILKRVRGAEAARQVPFVDDVRITAKTDQLLEPLPEAGSYLGFIFARAGRAPDAEAAIRAAHQALRFDIDPAIDLVRA
jgi:biotin carboxylase